MSSESKTPCPDSIVAALEDMTIEVAMLQQLVLNIAASAETVMQPAPRPADKSH